MVVLNIFYISTTITKDIVPSHLSLSQGILVNDTWIKLIQNKYQTRGPAKQFFPTKIKFVFKSIVFRILTNQGNEQYTCIYRFHMYGNEIVNI